MIASLIAFSVVAGFKPATQNVVFVMTDGLRWQEVFSGAERVLLDGAKNEGLTKRYWRETPVARREALLPFVWSVVAKNGQLYGNQAKGSFCQVTNGHKFSYPGYSESLCGFPDPRINSNAAKPNENVTVFEWLTKQPGFKGGAAGFGAWDVVSSIFNRQRCGFPVNSGYELLTEGKSTPVIAAMNRLKVDQPRPWDGEPYDIVTHLTGLEFLKANRPRLFYIGYGETDEWAHENKYGEYLDAARRFDAFLKEFWETLQSMPQYRGKTTLIVTTDHGRGDGPQWTSHGASIKNAEYTWIMAMGPDTKPLGERANVSPVTNSQVAATIARLMGYDYNAAQPKAGAPLTDVIGR